MQSALVLLGWSASKTRGSSLAGCAPDPATSKVEAGLSVQQGLYAPHSGNWRFVSRPAPVRGWPKAALVGRAWLARPFHFPADCQRALSRDSRALDPTWGTAVPCSNGASRPRSASRASARPTTTRTASGTPCASCRATQKSRAWSRGSSPAWPVAIARLPTAGSAGLGPERSPDRSSLPATRDHPRSSCVAPWARRVVLA